MMMRTHTTTMLARAASMALALVAMLAITVSIAAPASAASKYPRENASAATVAKHMPWANTTTFTSMWFNSRPKAQAELITQNPVRGGLVQDFQLVTKGMKGPFTVKIIHENGVHRDGEVPEQTFKNVRAGDMVPIRLADSGNGCTRFYAVVSNKKGTWAVTGGGGRYDDGVSLPDPTAANDVPVWSGADNAWVRSR